MNLAELARKIFECSNKTNRQERKGLEKNLMNEQSKHSKTQ